MRERATAGARVAQRRARLHVRRAAEAQDGFTLPEMLVVLAIVGIVLVGITQLFTSALKSQTDQTNRTQAQQDARLGLDKLRREIRCASALTTPSGYPASAITITLGSYCPTAGGAAATVTWCTKDKNGATPPVAGGAALHALAIHGVSLLGHRDEMGVQSRGQGRRTEHLRRQDLRRRLRSGRRHLGSGRDAHFGVDGRDIGLGDLLLRRHGGARRRRRGSGTVASLTIASGPDQPDHGQLVGVHGSDVVQRVRPGRQRPAPAEERHVETSYVDTGPTKLTGNPLTLPSATIDVASTSNFNAGANTIVFGPSGPVTCTGTATPPPRFTGCTGGQAGPYPLDMPVYSASSARPPLATLSVSLALDKTPASTSQRFVLLDNIVLRNSQPF